ncbi:glycosyltransferase family 4 protein [Thermotalea metallivorans]|uniref:D-inositol 3-phosphate glycosyltransferase n=1 Tax=Thermotalea metallivorans TaxID=520762 RepID=A0A140L6J0_9FIRM|nr:glycosyltransferase family 1 protein [Thermotalea metallivorans]KXG76165.1 D-inositol 3-phosphate glycosyltransferase [Thermotalea metallivorans]
MLISIDTRGAKLYAGTGIGTYTHQLMKNIMNLDRKNQYLFFWPGEGYDRFNGFHNIHVHLVGTKNKTFWTYDYIPHHVKKSKAQLFHIPQNGIGLPKEKFCKYVVTVHDLIPYILPETVGYSYRERFIQEMPSIIENADIIITVSEYSKQDIISYFGVPDKKIVVTPLAADDIYRPINHMEAKNFIKNIYGVDREFILYLGGFSPRKNILGLIRAYHQSLKRLKGIYDLVIVGAPKDSHGQIVSTIEQLGIKNRVIFTGFAPYSHLPYFYNAASLFVYPSIYEGFGLPPLEAMSCGCPTITSNLTSIPEVVDDAALLINPYDIDALTEAIVQVLEDKKLSMELIVKGLKRASQFSWENTAKNTLKVYEALLKV